MYGARVGGIIHSVLLMCSTEHHRYPNHPLSGATAWCIRLSKLAWVFLHSICFSVTTNRERQKSNALGDRLVDVQQVRHVRAEGVLAREAHLDAAILAQVNCLLLQSTRGRKGDEKRK